MASLHKKTLTVYLNLTNARTVIEYYRLEVRNNPSIKRRIQNPKIEGKPWIF